MKDNNTSVNIWSKTTEMSKKITKGIQSTAKSIAEATQKTLHEQKIKKYNPITPEEYKDICPHLPNVIQIVDDAVRRNIDVCEGAIGWRENVLGVEVLFLYDEWIKCCNLNFIPVAKCDETYIVDPFDRNKYIKSDYIFGKANEEKLAELEAIAYSLGAKSCSIEIVDESIVNTEKQFITKLSNANASSVSTTANQARQSSKTVSKFDGNSEPSLPKLKWFAHDDNITGLVDMRCNGKNIIKSKILELKGAYSATMSQKVACAVDKIKNIKGSASMETQAIKEHNSKLIFEIIF